MDIDIQILDWEQVDLDELALLTWKARQDSPLGEASQTITDFKNYLEGGKGRWPGTSVITARRNQKLVGWLGLIHEDPLLFELWRWHPFLLPGEDQDPIADALLHRALQITRENSAQSLQVCCHLRKDQLRPETERYLRNYQSWYEEAGLQLSDEAVYLTCPMGQIKISPPEPIHAPYAMIDHHPRYVSEMYECFLRAFSSGQDRSLLNKTAQQKKSLFFDYLETNLNPVASKVLLEEERVIGFTLVQTRERVGDEHLALIAIVPENQRRGWGRKLISASIQAAALGENEIFSIGVDLSNQIAYNLYLSLGFEAQTKLITHIWKNSP